LQIIFLPVLTTYSTLVVKRRQHRLPPARLYHAIFT